MGMLYENKSERSRRAICPHVFADGNDKHTDDDFWLGVSSVPKGKKMRKFFPLLYSNLD